MIISRIVLLGVFVLFAEYLSAQQKDWLAYASRTRNYAPSVYFTGFMSGYLDKEKDIESVKLKIIEQAKVQLSENIRISIESKIVNKLTNINSVSLEEFEKVSRSYTHLDLSGLKTDFYIDTRKKEVFAFAWVRKEEVIDHYADLIKFRLEKMQEHAQLANELVQTDQAEALRTIFNSQKLFREIEEAQTILVICGVDDPDVLLSAEVFEFRKSIEKTSAKISNNKNLSLTELSAYLAASLKVQIEALDGPIYVSNLTYRNSKMGNEFSERFSHLLQKDLIQEGFQVGMANSLTGRSKSGFMLSGNYWEDQEKGLHVVMTLRDNDKKQVIAGVEGWIAIAELIKSRLEYKPSNYFEAVEKEKLFSKNEIVNGGAKLEIWTNKGDNGVIFKEGDKVRLLVRLNRTGYIRLINHWADGTQALLVDNYFIDYRKVNRIIQLPLEWEVACPCGAEFVQVHAQNVEFVPLETENKQGFQFITKDVSDVIRKNRSYGVEVTQSGGFAVEERLVLATIE